MNQNKVISQIILSTITVILSSYCFSSNVINIKGLDKDKSLETYLVEKIILKYKDTENINTYAMRQDVLKALKSKGYYSAKVKVIESNNKYNLLVDPENIYKVSQVKVEGFDYKLKSKIAEGDTLDAERILTAQKEIFTNIKANTCYYHLSINHKVKLYHDKSLADITFKITKGPKTTIGNTKFVGLKTVKQSYLRNLITYKEGGCWNLDRVEDTKTAFIGTSLFSFIKINLPDSPSKDGLANIEYDFNESKHRSIRFGASHYSDEGFGFLAKWTHKNLLGSAEELSLDVKTTSLLQSLRIDFTKPQFYHSNQSIFINTLIERKNTDAFRELGFNFGAGLKHTFSSELSGSIGVAAGISTITDESDSNKEEETFGLISLPGVLTYDSRDDKLDPHKGFFSLTTIEPFGDILGESSPFIRVILTNSTYFNLNNNYTLEPILALRNSIGNIFGNATDAIPSSKRFFAGGGNSVRGVEFQKAGPLSDGDPLGGRSLFEFSTELRLKVTDRVGVVSFVDMGNVFDSSIPDFKNGLFVGAGAGIRYYTGFGPIRFDLAFPLNKREERDQKFQFYISIGQAY